jgi:alkylation response protein AidB-like acyl-CoA dehydrogenase
MVFAGNSLRPGPTPQRANLLSPPTKPGVYLNEIKSLKNFEEGGMDFSIPETIRDYLNSVSLFVKKEIEPLAEEIDRQDAIPQSLIRKMGEMGLFGLCIPKKYGGLGLNTLESCIIVEELAKAGLAFVRLIGGSDLNISELGTEEQDRKSVV